MSVKLNKLASCILKQRILKEISFTVVDIFHMFNVNQICIVSVQLSLVAQLCLTLGNPVDYSTPGLPVHHQLLEFTQTHVHWVGDAIQPSHPLSPPSPPTFNLSQHQGLFKWVSSSHQVAKVLGFQLQHQSFQWTPRTDLLWNGLVGSPCCPGTMCIISHSAIKYAVNLDDIFATIFLILVVL